MSEQRIGVTVVGGYLGAGKTTLVNHVLRSSSERVAVIVNDFGEISIDEDLIAAADGDKLTLANGCICCSLADGFAAALHTVRSAAAPPQRLLIEASGVADPAQIAAYGHTPGLRLDAVVVVADAEQVRRQADDRWVADIVRRQLAAADLLVVNKVDLLESVADVDALCGWLQGLATGTAVVRASRAAVPTELLFGPDAKQAGADHTVSDQAGTDHADADVARHLPRGQRAVGAAGAVADDIFESQTAVLDAPVPLSRIEAMLAELPAGVVRLKGLVQIERPADAGSDPVSSAAEYLIEAVGARTSIVPLPSGSAAKPPRWAVSLIALKGTVAPDWIDDRLRPSS